MKTRIISALIGLFLLFGVVFAGDVIFAVSVILLTICGMYELYGALEKAGHKPVKLFGYMACLFPALWFFFKEQVVDFQSVFFIILCGSIFLLFFTIIFEHKKYSIVDASLAFFGSIYVVFLFSFLLLVRYMQYGAFYIWIVFIAAWATDTFAYFTGVTIGKIKILPEISPKKSLEGSIGGILGCIICLMIYGYYLRSSNIPFDMADALILGALCGVLSQIGDWSASVIKRYCGIKDFSNIMPGHGGVLDRFDSILFTAPVVYLYISGLIIA